MPFFEVVERKVVSKFNVKHGLGLRLVVRSTYVGTNIFGLDQFLTYVSYFLSFFFN